MLLLLLSRYAYQINYGCDLVRGCLQRARGSEQMQSAGCKFVSLFTY